MKKILFILLLVLFSCGRPENTPPPAPAPVITPAPMPAPVPGPVKATCTKIVWSTFTNSDGSPAVVDGYKIYCGQDPTALALAATTGITTEFPLSSLAFSNGLWYCGVTAFNSVSESEMSTLITITVDNSIFYK